MIKDNSIISSIVKGSQIVIDKIMKGTTKVYEAWKLLLAQGIPPLTLFNCKESNVDNYKIYGNSKQGMLPEEYQRVEYIEATGTQYFEIDYIPNQNTNSKGNYQITDTNVAAMLFGAREKSSTAKFYGFNWGGGRPYKYYNSYYTGQLTGLDVDEEKHTFSKEAGLFKIDGEEISNNVPTVTTWNTVYNMVVFGCKTAGSVGLLSEARIFDLQFSEGDKILYNLIPCYRKSDNVIGMYDLINDVFYINQGTGTFLKGDDLPTPDIPIEIESVGDYDEATSKYKIPVKVINTLYDFTLENIQKLVYNASGTTGYGFDLGVLEEGEYTFDFEYDEKPNYIYLREKLIDGTYSTIYITTSPSEKPKNPITFNANGTSNFYIVFASSGVDTLQEAYDLWKQVNKAYLQKGANIQKNTTNIYSNQPLRKSGIYADYVDFKNQKIVRLTESIIFDGSENWEKHTNIAGGSVFRLDGVINPKFGELVKDTFMTHFQPTTIYTTAEFTPGLYRFTSARDTSLINGTRLYMSTIHTTVEEFKEWLAENRPELVYFINDEIPNDIELPTIQTNRGTNMVEVDTKLLPSNLEIQYFGKE